MVVKLYFRRYGIHEFIKEVKIKGSLEDYYFGLDNINEELLLKNLPDDFLPVEPSKILLLVENLHFKTGEPIGSTGQRNLSYFKNWEKYFHSYCIELCRD